MGISVADNFKHLSKKFLDDRESFDTLADMKAVSDSDIPEGFETYCKATDKRYKFLSTNSVDANTGKWREVEYGGGGTSDYADLENKPQIEGVPLTGNKTASDLGLAKANQIPTVPTKTSQLQNDSGFITNSALPGVYAGDTAGLVPAAGSDNEGKYLDNDGNWTDPLEDLVQNSGGKVLLDIPANTYSNNIQAVNKCCDVLDTLSEEQLRSIVFIFNQVSYIFQKKESNGDYEFFTFIHASDTGSTFYTIRITRDEGCIGNKWDITNNNIITYGKVEKTSDAQIRNFQLIDTSVSATMIGKINRSDIYDTTEKVVGKWTDGRPVYQKTITGTLENTTQEETVKATFASLGVSIQEFVDIHGVIFTDAGKCIQMSVTQLSSNQKIDVLRMVGETNSSSSSEKNGIHIYNSWYTSGTNTYKITARYTKTTDAANSYNYADENDYSTSEKIIGKWIDGKPLYQKTIVDTMPTDITAGTPEDKYIPLGANIDVGFIVNSAIYLESGAFFPFNYTHDATNAHFVIYGNILGSSHNTYPNTLRIHCSHAQSSGRPFVATIQYTKTTD